MADRPTLFADGIMEASVAHGVARLTLAQSGGDGKPTPCGQLIVPLTQLPAFVNGASNLLKQIETKAREAQAAQASKAVDAANAGPSTAADEPSVPGAFRFNG